MGLHDDHSLVEENKQKRRGRGKLLTASNEAGVELNAEMANCVYEHTINLVTRMQNNITSS